MTTTTDNSLARHYAAFGVEDPGRVLLTGHSHQAWPDVAREGQLEAFEDAAARADEKWERAFAKADEVRAWYRELIDDPAAEVALGASTHELVVRVLSALPLRRRPRLVTTDGEFHTLRRQLGRLSEEGIELVRVAAEPAATLAQRLAARVDGSTAAVLVSAVLFETAAVVPGLDRLASSCESAGAELVVDVYHALGPVTWSLRRQGLDRAWVVGGGYKYLQLGEGNCFLRLPRHAEELRPVVTGWYAEFAELESAPDPGSTRYPRGAAHFAGSTYDPTSHYRAARVIRFFREMGLLPTRLQREYTRQVSLLAEGFDALGVPPVVADRDRGLEPSLRGGFLSLRAAEAPRLRRELRREGVLCDCRGSALRLGPAPYLSDEQLESAVATLGKVLGSEGARSA